MGDILKADWPCKKGKEIDSAYFEDLRKILWGFNKLGCGITRDVRMKDWEGNWNYPFWSPDETYDTKSVHTVIYYDTRLREYLPYRNIYHVNPHRPPPPLNTRNWKRIPRRDVYCDYFPNKDIWHVDKIAAGMDPGIKYYPAFMDFPMYVGKYHARLATIPEKDIVWEKEKFYHYGDIVKFVPSPLAFRYWCKIPHYSIKTTAAKAWRDDKSWPRNAKVKYKDNCYVALRDISAGEPAPPGNMGWITGKHIGDKECWIKTRHKHRDATQPPADEIYGKYQEDLLEFSDKFLTGPIGPRFSYSIDGEDIPFYQPYYIADGRAAGSGHRNADMKASPAYQSYVENFLARFGSMFSDKNPRFDAGGTPDQQVVWKKCNDKVWRCNQTGFEYCLDEVGRCDWYLDIFHPPQTTVEQGVPFILGTWRRMWKYTFDLPNVLAYTAKNPDTDEMESWPLIWPQEKGPPPYQEYCYESIDADPYYNYDFWRVPKNVYSAYQRAVALLDDDDRKLVKQRHYHPELGDIKDWSLPHQLVQDMYDALLVYKYYTITVNMAGSVGQSCLGGYIEHTSFAARKAKMRSDIEAQGDVWSGGGGWLQMGFGSLIAYNNFVPLQEYYWDRWFGSGGRGTPIVEIDADKEILDLWAEQHPSLVVLMDYVGYEYYSGTEDDSVELVTGCYPEQISSVVTTRYVRPTVQLEGSNISVCSKQPPTTDFVILPVSERKADTIIQFMVYPSVVNCFAEFNSPNGQPRIPVYPGCPITQSGLWWYIDCQALVTITNWDSSGAVLVSPIQPLGCVPLED